MTKQFDFTAHANTIPDFWLNALSEFVGTLMTNVTFEVISATQVRVNAGAGNAQVSIGISGRWRYIDANAVATHPGGTAGTYGLYAVSADNDFGGTIPSVDLTDYDFTLSILGSPPVSGIFRKIGNVVWNGSAITGVYPGPDPAPPVPLGSMLDWPWASGSLPYWALLAYGQLLTEADYPALQVVADAAGRPFGGSAGVNFNLPDMRGRVGAGKDNMGGSAANRLTAAVSGIDGTVLGAAGGAEGVTLTTGAIPAHNHAITGDPNVTNGTLEIDDQTHRHGMGADTWASVGDNGTASAKKWGTGATVYGSTVADTGLAYAGPSSGPLGLIGDVHGDAGSLATANAGGGGAHQNVQPTLVVNKLMRVF